MSSDNSEDSILVESSLGKYVEETFDDGKELTNDETIKILSRADERGIEINPAYALLYIRMNIIDTTTGREKIGDTTNHKGSGAVLYRSDDCILVLTAWHNLFRGGVMPDRKVSTIFLMEDNKEKTNTNVILATMISNGYIRIGAKDAALIVMELTDYAKNKNLYKNDMANFNILDFKVKNLPGKENGVKAVINHYPALLDWYVKNTGVAYHNNNSGFHTMPTLAGSSGAPITVNDNDIIGVYHHGGDPLSVKKYISYGGKNILTNDVNMFELLSLGEIEEVYNKINEMHPRCLK